MMMAVAQEDPMGCGISCVASLCGISYQKAKKLFDKPQNAVSIGFFCRDIVRALAKAGRRYSFRHIKRKTRYPENSIVFISYSKRYPAGHFLVRAENRWMDPWMDFPSIKDVRAGFRKRLPGKAEYLVFPLEKRN